MPSSFPTPDIEIMTFPSDKWRGNDDPDSLGSDDNVPYYDTDRFIPEGSLKAHKPKLGEIASYDAPTSPGVREFAGSSGEEVEGWMQFEEFARVELGEGRADAKWYVISEPIKWESIMRFKRKTSWVPFSTEKMRENGSTMGAGHSAGY